MVKDSPRDIRVAAAYRAGYEAALRDQSHKAYIL